MASTSQIALTIVIVIVYAAALMLILYTAIQGVYLRSELANVDAKAVLLRSAPPEALDTVSNKRDNNEVRVYAIACDMRASHRANTRHPPRFQTTAVSACPGQAIRSAAATFQHPSWLAVTPTRSAQKFMFDVLNDVTQFIVIKGFPCRVRTATDAEKAIWKKVAPSGSKGHMLFVICDIRDAVVDHLDSDCVSQRIFAIPATSVASWPAFMSQRARAEQETGTATTLVHVWGYRT